MVRPSTEQIPVLTSPLKCTIQKINVIPYVPSNQFREGLSHPLFSVLYILLVKQMKITLALNLRGGRAKP